MTEIPICNRRHVQIQRRESPHQTLSGKMDNSCSSLMVKEQFSCWRQHSQILLLLLLLLFSFFQDIYMQYQTLFSLKNKKKKQKQNIRMLSVTVMTDNLLVKQFLVVFSFLFTSLFYIRSSSAKNNFSQQRVSTSILGYLLTSSVITDCHYFLCEKKCPPTYNVDMSSHQMSYLIRLITLWQTSQKAHNSFHDINQIKE